MQGGVNWSFAEECQRARTVADVQGLFVREMQAMGFPYVACSSHVDPIRPPPGAVMMVQYPRPWLERFSECKYAEVDPVFLTAKRQAEPFQWSAPGFRKLLSRRQLTILDEASEVGLSDGFTIPIHAPDALPASCSLAIGPDGVDPLCVRQAHWYAVFAHEAARRILSVDQATAVRRLSKREKECLELVARGKDDYAIGVLLGIQQSTAHNTVQRAMTKFGVATRVQAVVRAMRSGEIRLEDVAG